MSRSLNKVVLIGNLTRDPELRFTPSGVAVCTFGLATNRQWTTENGEKKEEVEFHRIVAWNKLAELCGQLLAKGRKVYVEGRLQTRRWTGADNIERTTTEIVISDMIILDSRAQFEAKTGEGVEIPENLEDIVPPPIDLETNPSVSSQSQSTSQVVQADDAQTDDKKVKTKAQDKTNKKSSDEKKSVEENKEEQNSDEETTADDDIPF